MLITEVSKKAAWTALAFIGSITLPKSANAENLFVVARSTNPNIVRYDMRRSTNGVIRLDDPVDAFWEIRAGQRRREELSWMERQLAYGFTISRIAQSGFVMQMVAFSKREIHVELVGSKYRARVMIAGAMATLNRVFVQADSGGILPGVRFIELQGITDSGRLVYEHITAE
jgi:hypothetical protein